MDCLRVVGEWVYHFQTLITGITAVLAAYMSIRIVRKQIDQVEVHRREDAENENKAAVQAFAFKAHAIIDKIGRNKRHIDDIKSEYPGVSDDDLWSIFRSVLGNELELERINSTDVSALAKIKKPGLGETAQVLERSSSTIAVMIAEHRRLMDKHDALAVGKTVYEYNKGALVANTRFYPNEDPELMKTTIELSELVKDLDTFINNSWEKGQQLILDLNKMFKEQNIKLIFE